MTLFKNIIYLSFGVLGFWGHGAAMRTETGTPITIDGNPAILQDVDEDDDFGFGDGGGLSEATTPTPRTLNLNDAVMNRVERVHVARRVVGVPKIRADCQSLSRLRDRSSPKSYRRL